MSTHFQKNLYNFFWKCVDILDNNGFTCDYVMLDGASTNRSFTNMLFKVDPREANYMFRDIFFQEHFICDIQDTMVRIRQILKLINPQKNTRNKHCGLIDIDINIAFNVNMSN
jgi:hypothetical protein